MATKKTLMVEDAVGLSGGTPGGSTTQIQFNDGGAFAGSSLLTFDKILGKVTSSMLVLNPTYTNTSGGNYSLSITPVYNQVGSTAANTDLLVNRTQTSVGSGTQLFADFQVGGTSKISFDTGGTIAVSGQFKGNQLVPAGGANTLQVYAYSTYSGTTTPVVISGTTFAQTSGSLSAAKISPIYNQVTSTASNTDLLINRTETSVGSGSQLLIDAQVGGSSKANITTAGTLNIGNIVLNGARNISSNTSVAGVSIGGVSNMLTSNITSVTLGANTFTTTSGASGAVAITPTYNQTTGTASNTDLLINRIETAIGSGVQLLIDAQVAGTSKFKVDNQGTLTLNSTQPGSTTSVGGFVVQNAGSETARLTKGGSLYVNSIGPINGSGYESHINFIAGQRMNFSKSVWMLAGTALTLFSPDGTKSVNLAADNNGAINLSASGNAPLAITAGSWTTNNNAFEVRTPGGVARSYFGNFGNLLLNMTNANNGTNWDSTNLFDINVDPITAYTGKLISAKVSSVQKFGVDGSGNTTLAANAKLSLSQTNGVSNLIEMNSNGTLWAFQSGIAGNNSSHLALKNASNYFGSFYDNNTIGLFDSGLGNSNSAKVQVNGTNTATSGTVNFVRITPTYNQTSGTASNTDFLINRTQTAVGSGTQYLIDTQVGGTSKFNVKDSGRVTTVGGFVSWGSSRIYFDNDLNNYHTISFDGTGLYLQSVNRVFIDAPVVKFGNIIAGAAGNGGTITANYDYSPSPALRGASFQAAQNTTVIGRLWFSGNQDTPVTSTILETSGDYYIRRFGNTAYDMTLATGTNTTTSGTNAKMSILPVYNQTSGTASNTDLLINRTQTAVGSGLQKLIDAQVNGSSKFSVDNNGNVSGNSIYGAELVAGGYYRMQGDALGFWITNGYGNAVKWDGNSEGWQIGSGYGRMQVFGSIMARGGVTYGGTRQTSLIVGRATSGTGNAPNLAISTNDWDTGITSGFGSDGSLFLGGTDHTSYKTRFDTAGNGVMSPIYTNTSGANATLSLKPTYNQTSSTASNTDLLINRTQTVVGSGTQLLIDAQVGGTSKFNVDNQGNTTTTGDLQVKGIKTQGVGFRYIGSTPPDTTDWDVDDLWYDTSTEVS